MEALDGKSVGFTDYGHDVKWSMGSFFFVGGSMDAKSVFTAIKKKIYERHSRSTLCLLFTLPSRIS